MNVTSNIPGRLRLTDARLKNNPKLNIAHWYLSSVPGVERCRGNRHTGNILIVYDPGLQTPKKLINALQYALNLAPYRQQQFWQESQMPGNIHTLKQKNSAVYKNLLLYAFIYLVFAIKQAHLGKFALASNVPALQIASIVTIISGYPLLKRQYKKLTQGLVKDSDGLLRRSGLGFTLLRESSKGVAVLALKEMNDYLKNTADIEGLTALHHNQHPWHDMAEMLDNGQSTMIPVTDIQPGSQLRFTSGGMIPCAGEILQGEAIISRLFSLGHPLAVKLGKSDQVLEGDMIYNGEIIIQAIANPDSVSGTKPVTYSHLPTAKKVERYQEGMALTGLILGGLNYMITGSFMNALSVLLLLTPSAAGVAYSSGIKSYVTLLNKHNVYTQKTASLDELPRVKQVFFDKTGTLSHSILHLAEVNIVDPNYSKRQIISLCAAAEAAVFHPVALTLQKAAGKTNLSAFEESVFIPSQGVRSKVAGHELLIGNLQFLLDQGTKIDAIRSAYEEYQQNQLLPVAVAIDGEAAAIIVLKEILRKGAFTLTDRLHRLGVNQVNLVSGDAGERTFKVAALLGFDRSYADCTAEDKAAIISEAASQGPVVMVGDGANDLAAMNNATVSMSLLSSAYDRVKTHSDCLIIGEDISRVADVLDLSRKAHRHMNLTLRFSQLFNLYYGLRAFVAPIDPFAAKSLNTLNSLLVLLFNQWIEHLQPARRNDQEDLIYIDDRS